MILVKMMMIVMSQPVLNVVEILVGLLVNNLSIPELDSALLSPSSLKTLIMSPVFVLLTVNRMLIVRIP
jgi:hypothetical protein